MTNMADGIVLSRIMTALDLEFKRTLHYHDEQYDSDNDCGLPGPVMRPVLVYLVSTTEASFNPADYKGAQCPISPFTSRWPRDKLPFHQGVFQYLTFDETTPPEMDSNGEEEDFQTADLDDPVWSEEPIPISCQQLWIHQILHHTPRLATPPVQPIQEEIPPEPEPTDIKILDDLPDTMDVAEEHLCDFDSWAHNVLEYQW